MIPERLQAARLRLATQRPYLAAALWALQPVERPGLGTLAVDRWWRLYYDPASEWSVEHLAGVLYHEICHLLRDHHARAEAISASARHWNLAADAEINDDLIAERISLPGQPVLPRSLGQPDGLLAEDYYAALQSAPQRGQPSQSPRGGAQSREGQQGAGAAAEQGGAQAEPTPSGGAADEGKGPSSPSPTPSPGRNAPGKVDGQAQQSQEGSADASSPGTPAGSQDGGAPESSSGAPSSQPAGASGNASALSEPACGPVGDGSAAGTQASGADAAAQAPAPGSGRCGSCAHGRPEPWEDPAPGDGGAPGLSRAEAELVRRVVAEAIRSRGDAPGHWRRWAEEKFSPRVDWRRELAATVRHALADAAGAADYSYRRPSRRQAASRVILPALRRPAPEVAVVVDTSGSMGDRELAQALAEVAGVLRACGLRQGVRVLAVDAQVQACRRVFRREQVLLAGGGGTDMGRGIEAALDLRPRPQVVVVLTDGLTPWPDTPPRNARVVVGLLGGDHNSAPAWARQVRIEGGRV